MTEHYYESQDYDDLLGSREFMSSLCAFRGILMQAEALGIKVDIHETRLSFTLKNGREVKCASLNHALFFLEGYSAALPQDEERTKKEQEAFEYHCGLPYQAADI